MAGFTLRETLLKRDTSTGWSADAVALVYEERSLTYGELATAVDEIAAGLSAAGFSRGDKLQVLLPNGVEYVELLFAVASLGGVLVPTNYLLSPREVEHMWHDSGSTWLVVHERFLDGIGTIPTDELSPDRVFGIGSCGDLRDYDELRIPGGPPEEVEVDINDVVLLQYTSGTSGLPKAAMHTHATLMWNQVQQVTDFRISSEDVYVCVPALCWAAGFHDFLLPVLWMGGKVVLVPSRGFDPDDLGELLAEHGGSIVVLVPSVLRRVVDAEITGRHQLDRLRIVLSGGESLPVELIERFQEQFPGVWLTQAYGMTEGPMIMAYLGERDAIRKRGSAGKAMSATQIRVVDAEDNEAAPGEVGEIVVRSPATMLGYANAEAKNAEVFRGGWFHTGDSGYVDEDGYLYIVGRLKDMFISGGLNVYPAEIERVILLDERVLEVAVIGVPDESFGEVGRAFVVVGEGVDSGSMGEELRAHAREHLAGFKVPKQWEVRSQPLPRTTSGKIKKTDLREMLAAASRAAE